MNIKNRIRKIEGQTKGRGEFCECKDTRKFETIYHEDGKPATSPELVGNLLEPIPDVCPECEKPIMKTFMIIDFVSSTMPTPEEAK